MRIVQICSEQADDYILGEVNFLDNLFNSWGFSSEVNPASWSDDDLCFIHYLSRELPENAVNHPKEKTVLLLHEYVDADFDKHYETKIQEEIRNSRQQLLGIVLNAELSLGHSDKACRILEELEAGRIRKVEPLLDDQALDSFDEFTCQMLEDGAINILCDAPANLECRLGDVIKSFFLLEKFENPDKQIFRLILCGDHHRCDGGMVKVQDALEEIQLTPELCMMTGKVNLEKRNSFFRSADLFLNFDESNLDGYCYLQAMKLGIPVVTSRVGAGADILQNAPGVFDDIIHSAVADSMAKILADPAWRKEYIRRQGLKLETQGNDKAEFTLRSLFSRFE